MRLRFVVLASTLAALVAALVPSIVSATPPRHNHGLTINATPNPIDAGDGVLIYGQLSGTDIANKPIVLYHHISGSHSGYTKVSSTTTDSHGFYEFTRAEGVVVTNRSWFVREQGVKGVHSRTVYERVRALVTLHANSNNGTTNHAIVLHGHVSPNHAGEHVLIQQQQGRSSSDDWVTVKNVRLGEDSNYRTTIKRRVPGEYDLRAVFPGDKRNIRGVSDTVSITIQQAQVAGFTISSSAPVTPEGSSVTISGVLDKKGTSTPESGTMVELLGRGPDQAHFTVLGFDTTKSDGSYSFTQAPVHNTIYEVRTVAAPHRHTAQLFQGVRDVVTLASSSPTSTVGGKVTFSGSVLPDKAGHVIYLQRLGSDGDWHTVDSTHVTGASTYSFNWRFGKAGVHKFRARISSDEQNVGAASDPVTVTVSGVTPPASLPPAS